MISAFIEERLKEATYKILEDGVFFGEIPSLRGVWSHGSTLEICRSELKEVLEEWLVQKLWRAESIPGFELAAKDRHARPEYA